MNKNCRNYDVQCRFEKCHFEKNAFKVFHIGMLFKELACNFILFLHSEFYIPSNIKLYFHTYKLSLKMRGKQSFFFQNFKLK